jgi:IclR family transcriptional regulator, KDG regulon repressor
MPTRSPKRKPAARGRRAAAAPGPKVPTAVVQPLPGAEGPKERGGIQSLERAFAILERVAAHREGIALADLCKAVGLHSSTTFHLVRTLVQLGYASQHPETKKYRIGRKLFSLAAGALDENELVARATPMIQLLAERTGESSHFAIRSGDDIVIVARTEGAGMFQLADRAGAARPANATALGKVLLAALAPGLLDRWLAKAELARFTPKTITEPGTLRAELDEVRRSGIAFDDGEYSAEVRCVAVPVYDFLGRVAGAIGISAPMWRLSLQALHEKSRHVTKAAAESSAELGFRGGSTAKVA